VDDSSTISRPSKQHKVIDALTKRTVKVRKPKSSYELGVLVLVKKDTFPLWPGIVLSEEARRRPASSKLGDLSKAYKFVSAGFGVNDVARVLRRQIKKDEATRNNDNWEPDRASTM
jgi:hypothetical protein